MSYILEALKKSEQEREREQGGLPDIKSIHRPSLPDQKPQRRWWPVILVIVVFVAGALAAVYITMDKPLSVDFLKAEQEPAATEPVAKEPVMAESGKQESLAKSAPQKSASGKSTTSSVEQKDKRVVFSKQELQHDDAIGNVSGNKQSTAAQQEKSAVVQSGTVVPDEAIAIGDIPDEVRKGIPRIAFEGHVYSSTPSRRSVMINGHKKREGDTIGQELMLRAITPEGAEFEYQGYRFKLNALQDWSFN